MRYVLTGMAAGLLLMSCQPQDDYRPPKPDKAERLRCEADGGTYTQAGLAGHWTCILPTPDAGQPCSDSDQCTGMCIIRRDGEPAQCSAVTPMFGCHAFLRDGHKFEICID